MDNLSSALSAIPALAPYAAYAGLVVAAFVATQLPPPAVGTSRTYAAIYNLINALAQNYGHATNANTPKVGK